MNDILTIKESTSETHCTAGDTAQHLFTVTNISGGPLRIGTRVVDSTLPGELTVSGPKERDLAINESCQIAIDINVPPEADAGLYLCRLLAFDTKATGDRFSYSPTVACRVEARPKQSPPPQPIRFPYWIAFACAALLCVGIVAYTLVPSGAVVPDVAGMSRQAANEILEQAGWSFVTEYQSDNAIPADIVVRQSPAAGERADQDDTSIALVVNRASVPDLVGQEIEAALETLAQLRVDVRREVEYTAAAEPDIVVAQSPPAGSAIPDDPGRLTIALTVAATLRVVPNVTGMKLADAKVALEAAKLIVATARKLTHERANNTVLAQSRKAGTALDPNQDDPTVELTVAKAPEKISLGGDGRCLEVTADHDTAKLVIRNCSGSRRQKWTFSGQTIRDGNGKCLDVPVQMIRPPHNGNGVDVQVYRCNSGQQQKWTYNRGQIVSQYIGKCLEVNGGELGFGGPVQLGPCFGNTRSFGQGWDLK